MADESISRRFIGGFRGKGRTYEGGNDRANLGYHGADRRGHHRQRSEASSLDLAEASSIPRRQSVSRTGLI